MKSVQQPALHLPGILVLLTGQLLPLVDFSIINVALAAISKSLDASHTQLELVVAIYGVAFAVCLALGGRLGDRLGRLRLYLWGVALFGLASLLCGIAINVPMLLVARLLQGAGAALMVPQILAIIHVCLKGEAHSKAIGAFGSVGGVAFIVGQVLGGLLVSLDIAGLGWRTIFLINIPFCLFILATAKRWIPETRSPHAPGLDLKGTALLAVVILCLLLATAMGPVLHWPFWSQLMLVAVPVVLAALWQVEKRQPWPLLPPRLLALGSMQFGLMLALLFFASWSGFMFVLALTLQDGAGLSPAQSGNAFITLGAAFFVMAMLSARLNKKLGKVATLVMGFAIQIVGLVGLIETLGHYWASVGLLTLAPATGLIGAGQALVVSGFYRIGLGEVEAHDAGAGSSMLSTVQQAALGLGPALFGAPFAWQLAASQSYPQAMTLALEIEIVAMLVLVSSALVFGLRQRRRLALD
ncbi:MFS transporter [Gallaecimonas mangrovi]|uniref:MFS transporter n=1 Tax=Gallaecimonas mangrovi TaxID=2291597 RepID=UPI000E20A2A4|nr:MFS transporter [Gallaecimonas mangrovi]